MAKRTISIDPITRVSGLLEIKVEVENNVVINAYSGGMQFRGFETIFRGRPPLDMIYLTARTCGICSLHHSLASTLALEDAFHIIPSPNGVIARQIATGLEFLQNHLRHIYQFVFPDFVNLEGINPLQKKFASLSDFRLPKAVNTKLTNTYLQSLTFSRKAHKALASFTGKAPHAHGIFVGGITTDITIEQYEEVKAIVTAIKQFSEDSLLPDIYTIAAYYPDYYELGKSDGNFLCYGLFDQDFAPVRYVSPATYINGIRSFVSTDWIIENVKYSWLSSPNNEVLPSQAPPIPNPEKEDAYSWVAAPRYCGYALEGGPIARMFLSGLYTNGTSTMDRLIARCLEVQKICECILGYLSIMTLDNFYHPIDEIPQIGSGVGLIEACRGPLAHFVEVLEEKVSYYTLLPPSMWNLSPRDNYGVLGPAEKALIGTPIKNLDVPVEVGRIIRSFDPCLNCAAHITSGAFHPFTIQVI